MFLQDANVLVGESSSFSSSIIHPYRKGCCRIWAGVMRYLGSTFSIFASRSIASWSTFW